MNKASGGDGIPTELSGKPIYIKHIYLGKSGKSIADKHHDPLSLISPSMNATLLKKQNSHIRAFESNTNEILN